MLSPSRKFFYRFLQEFSFKKISPVILQKIVQFRNCLNIFLMEFMQIFFQIFLRNLTGIAFKNINGDFSKTPL